MAEGQKWCVGCGNWLPADSEHFTKCKASKDGLQRWCKMCMSRDSAKAQRHDHHLRRKYGISLLEYQQLLAAQGAKCAICERAEQSVRQGRSFRLAVDHCHTTGKIRGLLCANCNRGVGLLGDDPEACDRAAEYLRRTRKRDAA